MPKTYLVTGGAGFIGSNFIHYILRKHKDVRLVNVDALTYAGNLENLAEVENDPRYTFIHASIDDRAKMQSLFESHTIDYVVNFAAESHVDRSIRNPEVFAQTNVLGTLSLLDAARHAWSDKDGNYRVGVRFLQVSTDEVYGALGKEGFFLETTPLSPHSPYSASKASADLFVKAYHDTFGLPVSITRCSNNYGPYQFPEKLIPLIINNCLSHKSLPIYGDGMQVRDWLYVEDHCGAIDLVLEKGMNGEVYNVGGHNEKTNISIVKTIINEVHDKVDDTVTDELITHVTDRKGHDRRYAIDPDKIHQSLGWLPKTPFEKGIKLTVDWYLAHREWMEHITNGNYQSYYESMYGSEKRNG